LPEQSLPKQDSLARMIGLARRRLKQAVGRRVSVYGLSPQQFWVVIFLSSADGPPLYALTERMRIDAPTASRIVAALVKRGLVTMRRDPDDRRRGQLTLTARGRSLATQLLPLAEEFRGVVERDLSRPESLELRRLLTKVISSLDRYETEGDRV
jgi:DNA-binding MarR family transcriptional regulator